MPSTPKQKKPAPALRRFHLGAQRVAAKPSYERRVPPLTPTRASVESPASGKENNGRDGNDDGKSFAGKRDGVGVERDDESIAEENLLAGVEADTANAAESDVVDASRYSSSESSTYQPDSSIDVSHDGSSRGTKVGVDASTQTGVPAEINVKVEGDGAEEIEDLGDESAGGDPSTPVNAEVEGSDSNNLQDEIDESNGAASVSTTLEEQCEHYRALYITTLGESRAKDATIKQRTDERNEATKRVEDAEKELDASKAATLALRSQVDTAGAERNEATKRAEDTEKELASRNSQLGAYKAANLALQSQVDTTAAELEKAIASETVSKEKLAQSSELVAQYLTEKENLASKYMDMAAENGKMAVENDRLKWWLKAAMASLALMVACLPPGAQLFVILAIVFCTIVSFIAFLTVA